MYFKEILGQVAENQARRTQSRQAVFVRCYLKYMNRPPRLCGQTRGLPAKKGPPGTYRNSFGSSSWKNPISRKLFELILL